MEAIATLCAGLFAGAAIYINAVEHPARLECGTALAVAEFGPSYRRATVMQASLAGVGLPRQPSRCWSMISPTADDMGEPRHPMTDALNQAAADESEIRRVTDELFINTDLKDWASARALFADGPIEVDMSSLAGGGPVQVTADQLIAGFQSGLHAGKVSHHLATNYRISVDGGRAEVWAHGYAWNRVPALPAGKDLWETWGNYRLSFRRVGGAWRLDGFRYYSKLTRGNDAVRTHTP